MNHDFFHSNVVFSCFEHPRYGVIAGIFKLGPVTIKPGEELFAFYGYHVGEFPSDHLWYHELRAKLGASLNREENQLILKQRELESQPREVKSVSHFPAF